MDDIEKEFEKEFRSDTKQKDKKEKPTEHIQKTSNIIEYPQFKLIESVIVGGIPKFLISDGDNIKIQTSIELEKKNLKPFESNMFMNKPYSFDSDKQVLEVIEKVRKEETLDTLYGKVKSIWKKYIDADDFHITICAADTIFTYFQDKIGLTH